MEYLMGFFIKDNCRLSKEEFIIQADSLLLLPFASTLLYELIKAYGFSYAQAQQLIQEEEQHSGALMYSKSHKLLRDRGSYIIRKQREGKSQSVFFEIKIDSKNSSLPF